MSSLVWGTTKPNGSDRGEASREAKEKAEQAKAMREGDRIECSFLKFLKIGIESMYVDLRRS
jgi:hypothetical protein